MTFHRYTLQPYKGKSSRYRCPSCNDLRKTFSRYTDSQTGELLAENVGRCDRESNCGYHYKPKEYFRDNNITQEAYRPNQPNQLKKGEEKEYHSIIPEGLFKASLQQYEENNFVKFLTGLFGTEVTKQLIKRYCIGTSKKWDGANVFWQVDSTGVVRGGKIIDYNPATGKRVKGRVSWVHSCIKFDEYRLSQCLFGEHLLNVEPLKPVAVVESEKTAIIASVYLPQFVWLATGGLDGFNAEKCQVLKGRKAVLYPDLKGLEKWQKRGEELSHIVKFKISSLLEEKATDEEKAQGLDLADYLIRFDYREFTQDEDLTHPDIEPLPFVNIQKRTEQSLKEQFKSEFLLEIEMPLEKQIPLCQDYVNRGLSKENINSVIYDLIDNYGFVWA